jgi:hypothetical protein
MCEFYVPLILLLSFNLIPVLIYYLAQLLGARSPPSECRALRDGTIPEEAAEKLLGRGEWLDMNGEAIYGTSASIMLCEMPNV